MFMFVRIFVFELGLIIGRYFVIFCFNIYFKCRCGLRLLCLDFFLFVLFDCFIADLNSLLRSLAVVGVLKYQMMHFHSQQ